MLDKKQLRWKLNKAAGGPVVTHVSWWHRMEGGLKYDGGRQRTGLSVLNGIDRLAPSGLFRFESDGAVKSRKHFHNIHCWYCPHLNCFALTLNCKWIIKAYASAVKVTLIGVEVEVVRVMVRMIMRVMSSLHKTMSSFLTVQLCCDSKISRK